MFKENLERRSGQQARTMAKGNKTLHRHENLKNSLVRAAERALSRHGLAGLRARALASDVGCAVGAIYNVVADLDELVLLVNQRTLAALERHLLDFGVVTLPRGGAVEQLVGMAVAYLDFASKYGLRWRAVFDHRLPKGQAIPAWYLESQHRLFGYVEAPLQVLLPDVSAERCALLARSIFSAVHGIIELGLDEKLQPLPVDVLREQVATITAALARGVNES
jgi:AcrR family transcriptional regulator